MEKSAGLETQAAFDLLQKALQDFCEAFNRKEIFPLLEADVTAYLYHRLLENGCSPAMVYNETRLCGISKGERKYDLVIGTMNIEHACIQPVLVVQVKVFQRWGHSHQQHRRRFEGILNEDLESLGEITDLLHNGRAEVVVDLVYTSKRTGYLSGYWKKDKRLDCLITRCKERNIALFWVHPNAQDELEVKRLT